MHDLLSFRRSLGATIALVLALSSTSHAATPFFVEVVDGGDPAPTTDCTVDAYQSATSAGPFAIPDGDTLGVQLGPLTPPDDGGLIDDVLLHLEFDHPAAGDIRVDLSYDENSDGTPDVGPVTLLCRPGLAGCPTTGAGGCFGDLAPGNAYVFSDDGAEALGDPTCTGILAGGCYLPAPESLVGLDVFDGVAKGGDFYLDVSDAALGDSGELLEWRVYWLRDAFDVGRASEIAMDSRGDPHVIYVDDSNLALKYAVRRNGSWTNEVVYTDDIDPLNSTRLGLGIDRLDRVHVAYVSNFAVRYAMGSASSWSHEIVAGGSTPRGSALAVDPGGEAHLTWHDDGELYYARRAGGAWPVEVVTAAPADAPLDHVEIAVNDLGTPIIAYESDSNELLVFEKQGIAWVRELVTSQTLDGLETSLALDAQGRPWIAFVSADLPRAGLDTSVPQRRGFSNLWLAERDRTQINAWSVAFPPFGSMEADPDAGGLSLATDPDGNPSVSWTDWLGTPVFASRDAGVWEVQQIVDDVGVLARGHTVDAHGNPKVAMLEPGRGVLLADAGLEILSPAAGDDWPVGSERTVRWNGRGVVDVMLSADGGATFEPVRTGLNGNAATFRVPNTPSRFGVVRVQRSSPFASAQSDSFFTIDSSIALLALRVAHAEDPAPGGAELSWETDPGPDDLAGYRVDRRDAAGTWDVVTPLTRETRLHDPDGRAGDLYRLSAVNGLGEAYVLGERRLSARSPLTVSAQPYRGGVLTITFATTGGIGGGPGHVDVGLFDVGGRLVRWLARGEYPAGYESVTWDGRDERGRRLETGMYFVRVSAPGYTTTLKLAIVR